MSKNVMPGGSTLFAKDSEGNLYPVISSTGNVYSNGAPINYFETISWSSGGLTPSTATAYGITHISMTGTDPSSSPVTLTLAPPITGVAKTIILDSTAAYINTVDVDLGAGVRVDASSDFRYIAFSTLAEVPQAVTLVGISTAAWEVQSVKSTALWGVASGIRPTTALRTS